jgi:hypothetical protein
MLLLLGTNFKNISHLKKIVALYRRSSFATLSPVLLPEQSAVVLLLERDLISWLSAIDKHGEQEDLRGSDRRSVISYVHRRMELYY